MIADGKKEFLKKFKLCLNKENIALSSGSIWCTSYKNEMKKVFWMFIFKNFIKATKSSVLATKLKAL